MSGEGASGRSSEESFGFQAFAMMDHLLDKLNILRYDQEFIPTIKMRPLNRHYFAMEASTGEQFFMFTSLAAWLVNKAGRHMEPPQEFDDPNSTIASILDALRAMGEQVDFSPSKLKRGFGIHVVQTLSCLSDKALEHTRFTYLKPSLGEKEEENVEMIEEDVELMLERVEEEMAAEDSDPDEDNILTVDDLYIATVFSESSKPEDILESNVSSDDWNLELERVLPLLKVSIKSSSGDWRWHLERMKSHQGGLEEMHSVIVGQLTKLAAHVDATMAKLAKREKFINTQLDHVVDQYRALHDELREKEEDYSEVSGGVVERQKILSQLTESLEAVRHQMEERGATMSDATPLVQIKKAIKEMKKELAEMDIQIAVGEHIVIEAKLREKSLDSNVGPLLH